MKVLYITGSCLFKNTSANMSHNAFIKGLIENDCQVDVVMADNSWGETDNVLPKFKDVNYYTYHSDSLVDKLRKKSRTVIQPEKTNLEETKDQNSNNCIKQRIRNKIKHIFYTVFKDHPVYGKDMVWVKKAICFSNKEKYDLVISNSSPASSHKLVQLLTEKQHIFYDKWIQIWEDPWFYDLYSNYTESIKVEEYSLLENADEIYYVSPLTLMYQKRYFPTCADKMKCIPLPFLDYSKSKKNTDSVSDSFGYFGDYYSYTRNLKPFYEALIQSGYTGNIYGDTNILLKETDRIHISGRVTLDILSRVQESTEVLVHLSNLKGGQIPGKIYHYSATTKPILFILDGTEEEKSALLEFFGKYNRYYFCENNLDSILRIMQKITTEKQIFEPIIDFSPKEVVNTILCN